jgi:hypothetical protein
LTSLLTDAQIAEVVIRLTLRLARYYRLSGSFLLAA